MGQIVPQAFQHFDGLFRLSPGLHPGQTADVLIASDDLSLIGDLQAVEASNETRGSAMSRATKPSVNTRRKFSMVEAFQFIQRTRSVDVYQSSSS
jgi:hypothetical protein